MGRTKKSTNMNLVWNVTRQTSQQQRDRVRRFHVLHKLLRIVCPLVLKLESVVRQGISKGTNLCCSR